MSVYFFDTSALKHRYFEKGPHTGRIKGLVSNSRNTCYIADWTVLEIASAFGDYCRGNKFTERRFDKMDGSFFQDLVTGRLRVRTNNSRGILRARTLLRKGVTINRNVGSGDALIAACCRDLALEIRTRITFYTADWGLYTLLREINAYTSVMRLRFVGTPKHGIPAET